MRNFFSYPVAKCTLNPPVRLRTSKNRVVSRYEDFTELNQLFGRNLALHTIQHSRCCICAAEIFNFIIVLGDHHVKGVISSSSTTYLLGCHASLYSGLVLYGKMCLHDKRTCTLNVPIMSTIYDGRDERPRMPGQFYSRRCMILLESGSIRRRWIPWVNRANLQILRLRSY